MKSIGVYFVIHQDLDLDLKSDNDFLCRFTIQNTVKTSFGDNHSDSEDSVNDEDEYDAGVVVNFKLILSCGCQSKSYDVHFVESK